MTFWRFIGFVWCLAFSPLVAAQPPEARTVRIAMVGDLMLAETPGRLIRQGIDPLRHFAPLLRQHDIRVGNLETVVATVGRAVPGKIYTFRAHPRVLPVLQRHFDAVSLANNHTGDYGAQAVAQMLDLIDATAIGRFGAGHNLAQAHHPWITERHGIKFAFLGYNEFFPRSFEADHDRPGIAWSDDDQVVHDIRMARHRWGADIVIPFMHWGVEYEPLASPRQRQLARRMIDAGADAVVGTHPHVTQDIETYRGKPIFYSLGNFVFDGFTKPAETTGWFLSLEVGKQGVRQWHIHIAHLDAQGTPRPAGCLDQRMNSSKACAVTSGNSSGM